MAGIGWTKGKDDLWRYYYLDKTAINIYINRIGSIFAFLNLFLLYLSGNSAEGAKINA